MNLTELGDLLAENRIDPRVLALGGRADLSWCIERASDGRWEVYWYERGNKNRLARLKTEDEACHHLLVQLGVSKKESP